MSNFARVFLNAKEEKEIQTGFPWVFDNEISHVKYRKSEKDEWQQKPLSECAVANGSGVEVFTKAGGFLGTGIINRNSKITIRLISSEHADKVFEDTASFWEKRIFDAVNIRQLKYSASDSQGSNLAGAIVSTKNNKTAVLAVLQGIYIDSFIPPGTCLPTRGDSAGPSGRQWWGRCPEWTGPPAACRG